MKPTDNKYLSYTFEGKEPWEEVKLVAHPHWATLVRPVLLLFFLWLAVAGIMIVFWRYLPGLWDRGWHVWVLWGAVAFTLFYLGKELFLWYNTVAIVTDYRVLQIRQRSLLNREVAATMWSNVMSVNVSSEGALASIFGFGKVICDPGGSELTVDLINVPDVYRVQQLALTLMRRAQEEGTGSREARHQERRQAKKICMD